MNVAARFMLLVLTLSAIRLQATQSSIDLDFFLQPLNMTKPGVESFFERLFNSRRYTEDIFPHTFKNLMEFLQHGKQSNQSRDYTKVTLSLFGQKLKGCLYVSAYAFNDFLAELPHLVDYHFTTATKSTEQKKRAIKEALYQEFLNNASMLSRNASVFFERASNAILQAVDPDTDQSISIEALQHTVIRFLETCLSKLLWDPTDRTIWPQVKSIADRLVNLKEQNIIADNEDLNDLCWSLIHRLSYFVDITGVDLPTEFYEQVRQDLQNPVNPLLTLAEQETLVESKRDYLEHVILRSVAKRQALQYGILTEPVIA